MTPTSYPSIVVYRHHFMAIFYSRDGLALTAAGESIQKTVPVTHPEFDALIGAGQEKRKEFEEQKQEAI